jgi:hypothetical protein
MRGERGAVLLQVLVMAMVASLMCATILRATFQPALTAAAGVERISSGLGAQAGVNRVNEVWARLGVCTSDPTAGVQCLARGSASSCACSCSVLPTASGGPAATVTSSPSGGACALTAVSP